MKASNRPRSNENYMSKNQDSISAKDVPLSEERLAILGHEIRNPLSALSHALQVWPSLMDDPQQTEDLLQIMRRQVSHLTRLCNDLLDTGRIAQGKFSVCNATLDLKQVIKNACEQLRPFIDQCGHAMTVDLGDGPLTLSGDESRLTQVFANLMHNAAKFTERNGHLRVSLEKHDDLAIVRFRDNGRGIDGERLRKIFLAEGGATRCPEASGDGLGIGLRLAKSIVEFHGGTIEAFSKGLGHGSTFAVTLPIRINVSPPATDISPPPPATVEDICKCLPHYRIVVVDDDRSIRFLMSRLLEKLAQVVTVEDCGETAIETIIQSKPNAVFLDLQMHGISGYEVARRLRSRAELNGVKLIALSGNADAASRRLAAESGFDQYLVKPTSLADLNEALLRIGE